MKNEKQNLESCLICIPSVLQCLKTELLKTLMTVCLKKLDKSINHIMFVSISDIKLQLI